MTNDNSVFQRYSSSSGFSRNDVAVLPRVTKRTTLNHSPANGWLVPLGERFNELTSLPRGWDGYGGRAVSFTCANFAAQLLERLFDADVPLPNLVPGADGTLQIEWHVNQYDIEIDVLAPFEVVASRYDCLTGESQEVDIEADISILAQWLDELKADRSGRIGIEAA